MPYIPKPGSFSLFKNDKKGVETRPDYTGEGLDLEGKPIRISAWLKQSTQGKKFMSCNIQPKEVRPDRDEKQHEHRYEGNDEDLPF